MEQCLEQYGGGISRIDVYSGYTIDIPPCVPISELTDTDGMFDITQECLLLGYDMKDGDDGELDHQTPASSNIKQQLQQQGMVSTFTATALITANIGSVMKKVKDLQNEDMVVVITTMDGTRWMAYLLPGTSSITADTVIDDEQKLTVSVTGKSMSMMIQLK